MIRVGSKKKVKREVFDDPVKAQDYFDELCKRRTDYPATVVFTDRIFVKKRYRIDKNWSKERTLTDEDL